MTRMTHHIVFTLFVTSVTCLFAQDPRGTISGLVIDSSNALIPGATVRATNTETGVVASGVSNSQGAYEIPYLNPGTYKVGVELTSSFQLTDPP